MKRYLITDDFRKEIVDCKYGINELERNLGFCVKNIINKNKSINEEHLEKLKKFLKISENLEEIKFDYAKNLGMFSFTQPIKKVRVNEHLAEFIGIMLGDGNIYENRIHIAFDKRNKIHTNHVRNLFESLFGIQLREKMYKETNQLYLYCYNKDLVQKLIQLGLKRGNKIKNLVRIPEWIKQNRKYSMFCIRGLIDTDGCVYKCKREKQTYIKFTNFNPKLLEDFKEIVKNLGYSFAKSNIRNACLYRKSEVAKFIEEIKPLKAHIGVIK